MDSGGYGDSYLIPAGFRAGHHNGLQCRRVDCQPANVVHRPEHLCAHGVQLGRGQSSELRAGYLRFDHGHYLVDRHGDGRNGDPARICHGGQHPDQGNAPLAYNSQPGPAQTTLGTPIVVTGASTFAYAVSANPGTFAQGGTASETYFATLRRQFNIGGFRAGVISASNDESTGESILNPEFMKTLTLGNLQNLKTPCGRQYLAFAQDFGEMWGIS